MANSIMMWPAVTVASPYRSVITHGDHFGFDFGSPEKPRYTVKKDRKSGEFIGAYTCKVTKQEFALRSPVESAVKRGMGHFVGNWEDHLDDLDRFPKRAKIAAMRHVYRKLERQATKEMRLEVESKAAEQKAKDTLRACLKPDQLREFDKDETFTVDIPDHGVKGFPFGKFIVKKSSAFNVMHIESKESFCVVAAEAVPVYDQMLTQKLLLENEPKRFFKTANRTGGPNDDLIAGDLRRAHRDMVRWYTERLMRGGRRLAV